MAKRFSDAELNLRIGGYWKPEWDKTKPGLAELNAAIAKAREGVAHIDGLASELMANRDYSDHGKGKKLKAAVQQELDLLHDGHATKQAVKAVEKRRAELTKIVEAEARVPSDPHSVQVASEIRRHVASLSDRDRIAFMLTNRGDPRVAQAILNGPAFLSGMNHDQQNQFRLQSQSALHPEESQDLETLEAAWSATSTSIENAKKMLADRTGLTLSRDGTKALLPGESDTDTPQGQAA